MTRIVLAGFRDFSPPDRTSRRCRLCRTPSAFLLFAAAVFLFSPNAFAPERSVRSPERPIFSRISHYSIRASLFLLGDIGEVGRMTIEERTLEDGATVEKILCLGGSTTPEQIRRGRDIRGEFRMVKRIRLLPEPGTGADSGSKQAEVECLHTGFLKQNEKIEKEEVLILPGRAVARREDGSEKILEGDYGSLLSVLEHFLESEVRNGDVYESRFILGDYPYIFKCEVGEPTVVQPLNARGFPIDVTTYDGILKDGRGMPLVRKKKGGIRLWLSKEEPFENRILRMSIRYRWYLTLNIQLDPGRV